MSVLIQLQLPVSYDEFQALDNKLNPEKLLPPGCLVHVVSRNAGGITVTDIWEDEVKAKPFYQGASDAMGIQFPPLVFSEVLELHP